MLAIKTDNLSKKFPNNLGVSSVNLEIEQGHLVALLGVNGAGKTTIIKMSSCLINHLWGMPQFMVTALFMNSIYHPLRCH